ncbi:hypothetical protein ACFQY7_21175 [Actinomadura luteofluorescens]|uniref:hypothetical protein n=1 Tax=Actinomadura luteofluorescens TaxID=46163 RepID=UPI003641F3C6
MRAYPMKTRSTAARTSTHASHDASPTAATSPYRTVSARTNTDAGTAAAVMPAHSASQTGKTKNPHGPPRSVRVRLSTTLRAVRYTCGTTVRLIVHQSRHTWPSR